MDAKKEFELLMKKMNELLKEHGSEIKTHFLSSLPEMQKELMSIFSDLKENFEKYTESPERKRIFDVIIQIMIEHLPLEKTVAIEALDCVLNKKSIPELLQESVRLVQSWLLQVDVSYEKLPSKKYQATTTIFFDTAKPKKSINITKIERMDLPEAVREKFILSGETEVSVNIYTMGGE